MASWFRRTSAPAPEYVNAQAAQGRPLLLIGFNESTSSWEVGQEALGVLQTVKGPLCTISVCGRARQGKSFLLNQLLSKFTGVDRPKGFVVSPTHQSCTRGIWIWSVPIIMAGPDGRKCNTILMDCEGVDAVDQGQQHSAQIFSLAVLLSSIFVYNQVGAIDAIAIERLAMVCELAKRIRDKSLPGGSSNGATAGTSSATGQVDFSPAFIWLLRDFQLRLESGGRQISPAEYLEEALLPIKGGEADLANRNQMRATIKAVFPDRDVATLVRPALTEAELQKLDTLPTSALRPEFRQDMEDLVKLLRSKARPLAVGGTLVSGLALAGLAEAYVSAVNQGAVPQLVTAWQGVSRAESQKAFEAAIATYNNKSSAAAAAQSPADEHTLYEQHQAALTAALDTFKAAAMGEPELLADFESRLRSQLEGRYLESRRKLAATGEKVAADMLAAESVKLRALMSGPGASVEAVEAELRRFLDEYDLKVPSGPYKYKKAAEFLMNTTIIGIKGIVKDILAAKEAAAQRAATAEATVTQLRKDISRLNEVETRSADTQQQLLAAQQEAARLSGQLEARARHVASLESELAAARQTEGSSAAARAKLQQELAAAQGEVAKLRLEASEGGKWKGQVDELRARLSDVGQKEAALQGEKAAAQQEATRLAAQLSSELARIRQLESEAAAGRTELDNLRAQIADLKQQLEAAQAAQVEESHLQGQLAEERKKVTEKMEEVATLTTDLAKERKEHDATRAQLAAAKAAAAAARSGSSLRTPGAAAVSPAGTSGGRSAAPAAAAAAAAGAGGRQSRKRQRTAAAADEDETMQDAEQATPLPAAAPEEEAPAAAAAAAGVATPVNKDIHPEKMTVNALKEWVTDSRLDDEEFFKLSQSSKTKKADWVKYVQKKLAAC